LNYYLPKIFHGCPFAEEICTTGFCVPVSVTSQLKVVRLPVFVAAFNFRVAWIAFAVLTKENKDNKPQT
jgi:hypothetical protein